MAIVVILVLLVAVGVGVGVALSAKSKKSSTSTTTGSTSVVSPTRPTFTEPPSAPAAAVQDPGPDAGTAGARAKSSGSSLAPSSGLPKLGFEPSASARPTARTDEPDGADDEDDADLSNRFNPRGERASGTETYTPTVPRKPVLLGVDPDAADQVEAPGPAAATETTASAIEDTEAPAVATPVPATPEPEIVDVVEPEPEPEIIDVVEPEPEPEPEPEIIDVVEPEPEPEPVDLVEDEDRSGPSSLEDVVVADVVAASTAIGEPSGEEVVIDLDESDEDAVLVIDGAPEPLDEVETHSNDDVLKALIGRVRVTQDDVDAVAGELGQRDDLDADGVAEVLADLASMAQAADRDEELTLFSEEVPSRPGQLSRFAELEDAERRRVIIRVLCLLVARAEETEDAPELEAEVAPARDIWPDDDAEDADEEPDLPNRVGLVSS